MFRSLNAAGLGTMLVALVVGTVAGPDSLKGQVTDSPVGVALQHMLEEHVKDRRAVVVLDRFPRTDLVVDVATAAGHQAARRDQARECQGELSDADWECWITADAERLVELRDQEWSQQEDQVKLIFLVSEEVGDPPSRRVLGFQRILTLHRSAEGWVVVSDEPGIKS